MPYDKQIGLSLLTLLLTLGTCQTHSMEFLSRNKGKIAAGIGATVALGALYYGYNHGSFNFDLGSIVSVDYAHSDRWAFEHREEKQFSIADQSTIKIENRVGSINVSRYDGDLVQVTIHKRAATQGDLDNVSTEITESERNLSIKTKYHQPIVQALINYKLRVPRNKAISLAVSNNSGDISMFNINGSVKAYATSGNITVNNVNDAVECSSNSGDILVQNILGNLDARAHSGQITATTISDNLFAKATSGDVKINGVGGVVEVHATSGDVKILAANGNAVVHSGSGNVHIANKGSVDVRATSGDVTLEQSVFINSPINIQASSGNITLNAHAINGQLAAHALSGEIKSDFALNNTVQGRNRKNMVKSQIGAGGAEIKLITHSGDIKLRKK